MTSVAGAESTDERPGEQHTEHRADQPDAHGQPEAVDALRQRSPQVAGPDPTRHARRGAVGQEDAQPDDGLQHHGRDPLARELGGAEVADDRRVREQEQRLGHQRQEGGDGEPQDLPVVGAGHGASLRPAS